MNNKPLTTQESDAQMEAMVRDFLNSRQPNHTNDIVDNQLLFDFIIQKDKQIEKALTTLKKGIFKELLGMKVLILKQLVLLQERVTVLQHQNVALLQQVDALTPKSKRLSGNKTFIRKGLRSYTWQG